MQSCEGNSVFQRSGYGAAAETHTRLRRARTSAGGLGCTQRGSTEGLVGPMLQSICFFSVTLESTCFSFLSRSGRKKLGM